MIAKLLTLPRQKECRGGFTLVEMLLVLAILATISALALPAVSRWLAYRQTDQLASEVIHLLQESRLAALRTGDDWCVRAETNGTRLIAEPLKTHSVTKHAIIQKPKHLVATAQHRFDIEMHGLVAPHNQALAIRFYADGTSSGGMVRILDSRKEARRIEIHPLTAHPWEQ